AVRSVPDKNQRHVGRCDGMAAAGYGAPVLGLDNAIIQMRIRPGQDSLAVWAEDRRSNTEWRIAQRVQLASRGNIPDANRCKRKLLGNGPIVDGLGEQNVRWCAGLDDPDMAIVPDGEQPSAVRAEFGRDQNAEPFLEER